MVGQAQVAGSDGTHRVTDGAQVRSVRTGRRERLGVEPVEPCLGLGERSLELFTGPWQDDSPQVGIELGSQRHGVDRDRLAVLVVINDDDLQQPAGAIGTDDEVSAGTGDQSNGKADGMQDVFVEDAVLSRTVRDVHLDKVALSA